MREQARRFAAWLRSPRGTIALLIAGLTLWAPVAFGVMQERREHAEEQRALLEFLATPMMVPIRVTIIVGTDMATTEVIEEPLFRDDLSRVIAPFDGRWRVWLRHVDTDTQICTMPATQEGQHSYRPDSPRVLRMTWADYTGDDGRCWARMTPGEQYDIRVLRRAVKGKWVRDFEPVRSQPFVAP
jgi:hypothetical protein